MRVVSKHFMIIDCTIFKKWHCRDDICQNFMWFPLLVYELQFDFCLFIVYIRRKYYFCFVKLWQLSWNLSLWNTYIYHVIAKPCPGSARFTTCWQCERYCHPKCVSISGRAADAVLELLISRLPKAVHWSLSAFFQTKICSNEIGNDLRALSCKFGKGKTICDECSFLNKRLTCSVAHGPSPVRPKKARALELVA